MLTMRTPEDDVEHTSGREQRDGRGDEQEMEKGRTDRVHHPSEEELFLAVQSTSRKRTKKESREERGAAPGKKRSRVRNTLPKKV